MVCARIHAMQSHTLQYEPKKKHHTRLQHLSKLKVQEVAAKNARGLMRDGAGGLPDYHILSFTTKFF